MCQICSKSVEFYESYGETHFGVFFMPHSVENCKNCSSTCAYDCAQFQYTLQHRTGKILPRSSQGNPSVGNVKRKRDFGPIET